jgi:SAM-dependent methyltransferase
MSGLHWPAAAHCWAELGPPLKPHSEDLDTYDELLATFPQQDGPLRALLLGVTPELYFLLARRNALVLAIDHTQAMISAVWPGSPSEVLCAQWQKMPLPSTSYDLAFCDGGFHLQTYPHQQDSLAEELGRVIVPGGIVAFRLFVPPRQPESRTAVLEALLTGQIPNLNVLKLRLGMALQDEPSSGVRLGDVYREVAAIEPSLSSLAERLGWPLQHLSAIETYRDSPIRYHFVNEAQVVESFRHGGFHLVCLRYHHYELGDRCPIAVFRRM